METTNNQLRAHISERSAQLRHVAAELKTELFGIDDIIDRVIDTIRAWYVLPDIINRPVIVNLWGLTGTGKTQLIRSLSKKLGFYDRLIEVQMDGYSNGGERRSVRCCQTPRSPRALLEFSCSMNSSGTGPLTAMGASARSSTTWMCGACFPTRSEEHTSELQSQR